MITDFEKRRREAFWGGIMAVVIGTTLVLMSVLLILGFGKSLLAMAAVRPPTSESEIARMFKALSFGFLPGIGTILLMTGWWTLRFVRAVPSSTVSGEGPPRKKWSPLVLRVGVITAIALNLFLLEEVYGRLLFAEKNLAHYVKWAAAWMLKSDVAHGVATPLAPVPGQTFDQLGLKLFDPRAGKRAYPTDSEYDEQFVEIYNEKLRKWRNRSTRKPEEER